MEAQSKELNKIVKLLTKAHELLCEFGTSTTLNHAGQVGTIAIDLELYAKEITDQGKV